MLKGEKRFAQANEMVQWTISSDERRELGRAAGPRRGMRRSSYFLFNAKAPGPAAARYKKIKQKRMAASPRFATGKKFIGA